MSLRLESWDFDRELSFEIRKWPRSEVGRERLQLWLLKKFPEMTLVHLLEASLYQDVEIEIERESDYYGENTTYEVRRGNYLDCSNLYAFLVEKGYINDV